MSGQSSEEEEVNYWPGYVDALTTMTMVLTFIMMILGIVVFSMSQNIAKKIVESVAEKLNIELRENMNFETMRDELLEKIAKIQLAEKDAEETAIYYRSRRGTIAKSPANSFSTIEERLETKNLEQEINIADNTVSSTNKALSIKFKNNGVRLDQKTEEKLREILGNTPEIMAAPQIIVKGYADILSFGSSTARRLAYYRSLSIRRFLIQSGVDKNRIKLQVNELQKRNQDLQNKILIEFVDKSASTK